MQGMAVTQWYQKTKRLMALKKISQTDICLATGISSSGISMLLNGKRMPRIETIEKIADVIGVDPAELIAEDARFAFDASEKELLDIWREIPQEDRDTALRILLSLRKNKK